MFQEFCTALMLECVHQKHGRKFTLDAMLEDYFVEIAGLLLADAFRDGETVN